MISLNNLVVGYYENGSVSGKAIVVLRQNFLLRRRWSALSAELELYYLSLLVLIHNILISFSHFTFSHSFSGGQIS